MRAPPCARAALSRASCQQYPPALAPVGALGGGLRLNDGQHRAVGLATTTAALPRLGREPTGPGPAARAAIARAWRRVSSRRLLALRRTP